MYNFIDKVIKYETGTLPGSEVLTFFAYIIKTGRLNRRFSYPWLIELMDYEVLTETGSIDLAKLEEYKRIDPLKL